MNTLKYISIIIATLLFSSCGEDFLEREDLFTISSGTFYSNPDQINAGLTAAYSQLAPDGGSDNAIFLANMLSDDCFGGGGPDNVNFQNTDGYRNTLSSQYEPTWMTAYAGIVRANLVIEMIDDVEYSSEADKNQAKGEAYFLRAFFHFRLTQLFGAITLKPSSAPGEDINASFEEIYALIASDLKTAIEIMPSTPFASIPVTRNGYATKWAAEALMARVFLFYTGYHGKTEIALSDGTSITKANVITWIDDCIANSGHGLVEDFRNLWPYASTASDSGTFEYPWAKQEQLEWVGDGNKETVFAVKYSIYGSHNPEGNDGDNPYATVLSYSNQLTLYMALRAQEDRAAAYPFGMGWGGAPVNPQLYDSYDDDDTRKMGSIINVTDPAEGLIYENYEWGKWEYQQETGYSQKKYTPITWNDGSEPKGMYSMMWGEPFDYQMENMQDEILIRFADVILMAAELKEDVGLLNQIRTRAGLDPLGAYTLEALQNERRHELAFEGLRIYDLLRWGIAEQAFAKVKDIPVFNATVPGIYSATYRPETRGVLPIPESQIAISNGGLVQNPGW